MPCAASAPKTASTRLTLAAAMTVCKGDTAAASAINAGPCQGPCRRGPPSSASRLCTASSRVNALADGEQLTFDKIGVTIIYGDNGSGKSGYARILKKVCRARSPKADPILPNIYANASSAPPSATVEFSIGGQHRAATWTRRSAD